MQVLGRADDGALVTVTLPDGVEDGPAELRRRWPPLGLTLLEADEPHGDGDGPGAGAIALRTTLDHAAGTVAWDRLESDLGLFAAERVADRVAIHAALAVVDGVAVLLPGRSFAGKTTLGLALADAGATLASDEYALVDPTTGLVTGWPRPARVREGVKGSRRVPVAPTIDPTPVGLVALLRYRADDVDAVTPDDAPLTRADAVVAVLDETVCARSRLGLSLDAALAVTRGDLVRGTRGAADEAAAWLIARVAGKVPA
jgi:hypothetical protein